MRKASATDSISSAPSRLCIKRRSAEGSFAGIQTATSNLSRFKIAHVKSGEADGYPKTEDMFVDEETPV
uniref:Uncharacterized protein n=1 Tax=Arundo donax TaxID=35708 RepID=A0A0A9HVD7_ARUDO